MVREFATASTLPTRSSVQRWPITSEARRSLTTEIHEVATDLVTLAASGAEDSSPLHVAHVSAERAARRLERLRRVLDEGHVVDEPGVAVIGRRVSIREDDSTIADYTLVAPGEGDPSRGWISADSPLGAAILNGRSGSIVQFATPAGVRSVAIVSVG
jgi:transcription elongation factor GreA